jgi:hypothetical protein
VSVVGVIALCIYFVVRNRRTLLRQTRRLANRVVGRVTHIG